MGKKKTREKEKKCSICHRPLKKGLFCDDCYQADKAKGVFE